MYSKKNKLASFLSTRLKNKSTARAALFVFGNEILFLYVPLEISPPFRRFSALCVQSAAFLEIQIFAQIKRCQSALSGKGPEMNLYHVIFTANIEKIQKL